MTVKATSKSANVRRLYAETRSKLIGQPFERSIRIERTRAAEGGVDTYSAALSSEKPVARWYGDEVLVHGPDSINMERAADGLALLVNHDDNQLIGRVTDIKREGDKLRGALVFDADDTEGAKWLGRVARGFAGDVSIRYTIDDYEIIERKDQTPEFRVTRFTPLEASIVTVPADSSVGVGRSFNQEGMTMTDQTNDETTGGDIDDTSSVVSFEVGRMKGSAEGMAAERGRISAIEGLFDALRADWRSEATAALKRDAINKGMSLDQARASLFAMVNTGASEPLAPAPADDTRAAAPGRNVDQLDKLVEAASRSIEYKSGLLPATAEIRQEMAGNEFAGMRMTEIARECLRRSGIDTAGMDAIKIVQTALSPGATPEGRRALVGHGTSVFSDLLANTAEKALGMGYDERQGNWRRIARIGSVNDYRTTDRPNLGAFSGLDTVVENGEYKYGTMVDKKETLTAAKKGKLFAITREAILADDTSAFTRIPRSMGRAADRSVNAAVFAVLTGNPTMNEDSTTLFHANHANIGTSGVISSTTWGEIVKLMGVQTSPGTQADTLDIQPTILCCPLEIAEAAKILAAATAPGATSPNIYAGSFEVVSEPLLDTASTAVWYALANPSMFDGIEVAFVGGRQEPYLESKEGWSVDGVEYKVRHEYAVGPLDWRTFARNAGV